MGYNPLLLGFRVVLVNQICFQQFFSCCWKTAKSRSGSVQGLPLSFYYFTTLNPNLNLNPNTNTTFLRFYHKFFCHKLNWCFVLGNLLVIITILGFMNKNNVTNLFILNLSIGDLLVVLFALPLRVSTDHKDCPYGHTVLHALSKCYGLTLFRFADPFHIGLYLPWVYYYFLPKTLYSVPWW